MISIEQLTRTFVDMSDTLVDDFDTIDFLHGLTDRAAAISDAEAVGLMLAGHDGRLHYVASSNETGKLLELLQLQTEEGPCLDCYATGEAVVNADLTTGTGRWPRFAPAAIDAGFQSVHAFPLRLRETVIGALGLFGKPETHFTADEVKVVQALADIATIGILQERNLTRAEALTEQLQSALNSRVIIEQAKGAVAQLEGIDPQTAFERLRTQARSSRRRLTDVAAEILDEIGDTVAVEQGNGI